MSSTDPDSSWSVFRCSDVFRLILGTPSIFDFFNATRCCRSLSSSSDLATFDPSVTPSYAARVVVAPLPGHSAEGDDDVLNDDLREYFAAPRLLHMHDVFFVPAVGGASAEGSWIAVTQLDAPGLEAVEGAPRIACGVVQRARTTLLLQGTAHCCRPGSHAGPSTSFVAPAIPQALLVAARGPAVVRGQSSDVPSRPCVVGSWRPAPSCLPEQRSSMVGVSGAVAAALATLRAPLGRARGVMPAVLLHGCDGSGKRTAVARAAARHGLSVVEVDSALLHVTVDARVRRDAAGGGLAAAATADALAAAMAARPCILHIRHLEALLWPRGRPPSAAATASPTGGSPDPLEAQLVAALVALKASLRVTWLSAVPPEPCDDPAIVLVCSVNKPDVHALSVAVRDVFTSTARVACPPRGTALRFLQHALEFKYTVDRGTRDAVCRAVAGPLVAAPWRTVSAFAGYIVNEAKKHAPTSPPGESESRPPLAQSAVAQATARLMSLNPSLADAPQIPDVRYADVGGADEAKQEIVDMVRQIGQSGKSFSLARPLPLSLCCRSTSL